MADNEDFLEKDMFFPVAEFLREHGYEVFGEVNGCDIAASKNGEIIAVEMKKAFNLKLVYQAINRQEAADIVYVAVGRSKKGMRDSNFKGMVKLLKRLDVGLMTVAMDSPVKTVDVVVEPKLHKGSWSQKKKKLRNEIEGRSLNMNDGGTNKTEIITAYKEKSIEFLCFAEKNGTITNSILKQMGYDQKTYSILYRNYYGWFKKTGKAEYVVSEKGKEALKNERYKKLVEFYMDSVKTFENGCS